MKTKKTKVLYLVLDMDLGGLQRVVNLLIKKLDKDQFSPYLCCLDRNGLFCEELRPDLVDSFVLNRKPGIFDFRMFGKLREIIRDNKIDIIHCHNGCSFYAALAGRMGGVKGIIYTDHGRLVPDRPGAILEDRIASVLMSRVVGVSYELTEYLALQVKISKNKLATIINGVEMNKFVPLSDEDKKERRVALGLDRSAEIIGTVCRLDPIKNVSLLIESMPAITLKIPNCQAVIVGDGPDEKTLWELTRRLNLNSEVIFMDRSAEVEKIMPVFDVYVNTSLSEGTCMTILEAMSCGLPIIASAVGGNMALVDRSNGALFPAYRADLFQESVTDLLSNPSLLKKMGNNSREKVRRYYSLDRVVEQYEELYQSVGKNNVVG